MDLSRILGTSGSSEKKGRPDGPRPRHRFRWLVSFLAVVWALMFAFHHMKPLPDGISVEGPERSAAGIEFLYDLTFQKNDSSVVQQEIFRRVFEMIDEAEDFIVVDMFLVNSAGAGEGTDYIPLSDQLVGHLVARKAEAPGLHVVVITDEFNNAYGAYTSDEILRLRQGGIEVLTTRLSRLRDSNPAYSSAWRVMASWMGTGGPGWLPNPLDSSGPRVTARALFKLLNFKANHRKLIVADNRCLVASANPHDASSLHSNIAFAGIGAICGDLLASERAVAAFSGGSMAGWPRLPEAAVQDAPEAAAREGSEAVAHDAPEAPVQKSHGAGGEGGTVRLLTEGKIREAVLRDLALAGPGDRAELAMFYLSDRKVVRALLDAGRRGVAVRLVLDPNKDAFGKEKRGIPNRQVAWELVSRSEGAIQVRWYDTRGEQFHTKLVSVTRSDSAIVIGGSANLTRRNVGDYNLETDLRIAVPKEHPLARKVGAYFEGIFINRDGDYTLPFEAYRDDGILKRLLYRLQEFSGACTF